MKLTQYLTTPEVIELHRMTIEKHGGSGGVRDMGLIESALYRPQSGYYETLFEQAAALMQSFCMNHAFVDGNKRVSLLVTAVFLKINGYSLNAKNNEVVRFIIDEIIVKQLDVKVIAAWIEANATKGKV